MLNDFGYFYLQRDNLPEAEKLLRQAVTIQPKHKQAWGNLGIALGAEGRYQEAFEAFSKATTPARAHSNVGMILAQQQKYAEAQKAFQQSLAINAELEQPRLALAWLNRDLSATASPRRQPLPKAGSRALDFSLGLPLVRSAAPRIRRSPLPARTRSCR